MNAYYLDPGNKPEDNRRILVDELRQQGCYNTAKGLRDCEIRWGQDGGRENAALIFYVAHDAVEIYENSPGNKRDLWDAVVKATPPVIRISHISIRSKEEITGEARVSLLDAPRNLKQVLLAHFQRMYYDEAVKVVAAGEIEVGWDSITNSPVVVLHTTEEHYQAILDNKESCLPPVRTLEYYLDSALARVFGEGVSRRIVPKPAQEAARETGLNQCFFKTEKTILHDELRFRSPAEVAVYEELKTRKILFFPNAAAVLGGAKSEKREPDFLICHRGTWGVLEVTGETYHTPTNAPKDHARARLFQKHGLLCVQFYPAKRCESEPGKVVDEFLEILATYGR
jgi:hypothetical protein